MSSDISRKHRELCRYTIEAKGCVSKEKMRNKYISAPKYKELITEEEVDRWRNEFPVLKNTIHLANCSQSPQSKSVRKAIEVYLNSWGKSGLDWHNWLDEVELAKAEFAQLINADVDEIAVTASVSDAVSSIASLLNYTESRYKIVVSDLEFPTINYVWLAQKKYGAKVQFIPVNEDNEIDISKYYEHVDSKTLLTAVSLVYYLNGFKQDISKISEIVHSKGSYILVDAYQGLGTEPVDVKASNVDFLVSGNLKYLFGIPGIAFIYFKKNLIKQMEPAITGWFGQINPFKFQSRYLEWAESARRLETGTPPLLSAYAARAGMKIINDVGPSRIKDRIDMLSHYTIQGCIKRGLNCISPFEISSKASTTAIKLNNIIESAELEEKLREKNILVSARGDVIRIAPHFYNKKWEIDYALDNIKIILDEENHYNSNQYS